METDHDSPTMDLIFRVRELRVVTGGARSAWAWLGPIGTGLALAVAAVGGGLGLQAVLRDVSISETHARAGALRRLQADDAARGRETAAIGLHPRVVRRRRPSGRSRPVRSLRPGDGYARPGGSDRVRRVQRALSRLGLVPERVISRTTGQPVLLSRTGQFGPVTERGVRRFQRRAGLRASGVVDTRTLQRLLSLSKPGPRSEDFRRTSIGSRP